MTAVSNGQLATERETTGAVRSPEAHVPSEAFVSLIPRDFAREHLIVSEGRFGTDESPLERLAITESTGPAAVFNVGVRLGVPIETIRRNGEEIARIIDESYSAIAEPHAP